MWEESTEHNDVLNALSEVLARRAEPVRCFVVPHGLDESQPGLIVWMYVKRQFATEHDVKLLLRALLTRMTQLDFLSGLVGAEVIIARRAKDGGTSKLVRVTVHDKKQLYIAHELLQNELKTVDRDNVSYVLYKPLKKV